MAGDTIVDAHVANTAALGDDCAKLEHYIEVDPFCLHAVHNYPHDLPDDLAL